MYVLRHISLAISAAAAILGSLVFLSWNYFYKRRVWSPGHRCAVTREVEESWDQQILVLGLNGSGKSSTMRGLSGGRVPVAFSPTRGFNAISVKVEGYKLHLLEIGGSKNLRTYWPQYLKRACVLVYVVDSTDRERLPLAKEELHSLLQAASELPLVVLANKQDLPNAVSISELHEALMLDTVEHQRECFLLALNLDLAESLMDLWELLLKLVPSLPKEHPNSLCHPGASNCHLQKCT
ncbi:ADP-ribosylation factor-like 10 [Erpetoichthys calabaricus]|uniref:ADP-ribosylation factor-like 10 n=1 Tax=Erpetoichthys calabaricus TaxID=27687 RepID=A0A8C4XA07_ERPCA|nr:ADP-ribosylation factor-like 10 [Erpetoichthys calabaricus]